MTIARVSAHYTKVSNTRVPTPYAQRDILTILIGVTFLYVCHLIPTGVFG